MKKKKTEREFYISDSEFISIVRSAYNINMRYGILFDMLGNGGLRISEALAITIKDIDFKTNSINQLTLKRREPTMIVLKYPDKFMRILEKYVRDNRMKSGDKLFPFSRAWAHRVLKRIIKDNNLNPRYSCHAFRHYHGNTIAEILKGDPIAIAKRLRHGSVQYVMRYTHLTEALQDKIIAGMEEKSNVKTNQERVGLIDERKEKI